MSRAELARQLGVSRTYITLLAQGKRKPSQKIVDKLAKLKLTANLDVNLCTYKQQTFNLLVAGSSPARLTNVELLDGFIKSRRQGLSPRTIDFYRQILNRCKLLAIETTSREIKNFLDNLACGSDGKHGYYRVLKVYFNWLYSPKSGYNLKREHNPILLVDAPIVEKKILPSLTPECVDYVISQADCVRDKAIVSLFADSGLRLTELANIDPHNIDWQYRLIKVRCKGNKEGLAVFGQRTESFLKRWFSEYNPNGRLWDLNAWGIVSMLRRLERKTGLPCNAHTFRRTFASVLAKRGIDSLHIMRLGRWESIAMVERYTRSVKFEDSLKLYTAVVS